MREKDSQMWFKLGWPDIEKSSIVHDKGPYYAKATVIPDRKILRIRVLRLLLIVALFFASMRSLHLWQHMNELQSKSQHLTTHAAFVESFASHIANHPVKPRDRLGFAEMGLRCRLYASLLRRQHLPIFESFEQRLWPFIPGISKLRRSFFSKDGGRGIVMSLGRGELRFAMHFLDNLRRTFNSKLPVELYYYGDDDLPATMRTFLEQRYDKVRCIDIMKLGLFDLDKVRLNRQGWALKPFALVATTFKEVILADADAVFLRDPGLLFDTDGYKRTGTLFFHDRDHKRAGADVIIHQFLQDQIGLRRPSKRLLDSLFWQKKGIYEQESGVVVVDKRVPEVFVALLFAAWQNTGGIRELTTYRIFWGDKESYWLSFELAGFPYHFVQHYAGGIGSQVGYSAEGIRVIHSEHPLHFIESTQSDLGTPMWFNGGLLEWKHENDQAYLSSSVWGMLGDWKFDEAKEIWLLQGNKSGTLSDLKVDRTLNSLISVAQDADSHFLNFVDATP